LSIVNTKDPDKAGDDNLALAILCDLNIALYIISHMFLSFNLIITKDYLPMPSQLATPEHVGEYARLLDLAMCNAIFMERSVEKIALIYETAVS